MEHSVEREIKEELNIGIKILEIIGVYEDRYLYQDILNYAICTVVSAKIIRGKLKVSDDISGYQFFSKNDVFKQKLAFPSIKQGISDYLGKK